MRVAVRLLLVIGLLAAQYPGCKIAAAHSLVPARSHVPQTADTPLVKCNKGCCSGATSPTSNFPKPDDSAPDKSKYPTNSFCPLCSPAPALQPVACQVAPSEFGPAEQLVHESGTSPADAFQSRLDRPPRF